MRVREAYPLVFAKLGDDAGDTLIVNSFDAVNDIRVSLGLEPVTMDALMEATLQETEEALKDE
jgi:hypothetical protein